MTDLKTIYALLEEDYRGRIHTLGVYSTLELAREALKNLSRFEDCVYWVEEWPLNERKTKFNVMVVASEDSIE